jgi:ELWxxDGT repeat protein
MRGLLFIILLSISNLLFAQLPQKVSDVGDVFNWQVVTLQNHIVYTTFEGTVTYSNLYSSQGNSFGNIKICDSISQLISATKEKCFFIRKFDEIWVTDGTKSNTKMLFKLPHNFLFNRETSFTFTPSGDYLYFQTKDSINGPEFWVTDGSGSANSTKMLGPFFSETDQLGETAGFNQGVLLAVKNNSPLTSNDSVDLFYFNKDSQKPVNLTKGYPRWGNGFKSSAGFIPKVFKNKAYFVFDHRIYGDELFETDGTFSGTKVIDINPGSGNSFPEYPFIEFGKLFVSAYTKPGVHRNMVTIDESGIENILPFQTLVLSNDYAVNANGVFLKGSKDTIDNRGWEFWRTDGTKAGTSFVFDTKPGPQSGNPRFFSSVSNTIVFETNGKVFTSNGTDTGTIVMPIVDSLQMARSFQGYDEKIFFVGKLAKNNYHLYRYDKTGKATKIAPIGSESAINPLGAGNGSVDYGHNFLFNWKGEIYFLADYGQGKKLYKIGANVTSATKNFRKEEAQVQIYPNPAFSILEIQLGLIGENEINYSIFNSEGKLMQKLNGVSVDNNHAQVSVENLNAGLYIILVESKNSKLYKRFIKQ